MLTNLKAADAAPADMRVREARALAMERLRDELRHWRERKQLCARAFGPAKKNGDDLAPLKADMQAITERLAALETELAALEAEASCSAEALVRVGTSEAHADARVSTGALLNQANPEPEQSAPLTIETPIFDAVADWQSYADAHPNATLYHDVRWPRLMHAVFGHAQHAVVCRQDGALRGILPLVRQRSRLFGDFLTSLPFVNYGGALADSPMIEDMLMDAAGSLAARLGCKHVEFRDTALRSGRPVRATKVSMRLALPATSDVLWQQLGTKLRAQVKRPEREGATTRIGGVELVEDFYAVFCRNMRDLGTPVYPLAWFTAICERFAAESAIVVVYIHGKPVGAGFLLQHRRQVEIPWASTVREFNRYGVNMQLYWRCLCWAIERGANVFDFGRSSIDAGTHRFKAQWGATELPLHWHYWLPAGEALPELNPQNGKFALAIRVWQKLPVALTRWIGPPIVKYLP